MRRRGAVGNAALLVRSGQFAVEAERLGPGEQVGGGKGEFEPDLVLPVAAARQVAQAGGLTCADAVLDACVRAVPDFEVSALAPRAAAAGVGEEGGEAVSVGVAEAQLRTGVRPFAAHQDPRSVGPLGQVQQGGQFGDPRARARFAVDVVGRCPRPLGQGEDRLAHGLVDGEAEGEPCGCRKSRPRSCGERVFVDEAADAVVPSDSEGVEVGDGRWYRREGCRLLEGSVRAVLVVMSLVLAENPQQMSLVQINVWSSSSRRQPPIQRCMIAFARGAWIGLRTILIPTAVNTASKAAGNWVSRSRSRNLLDSAPWSRSMSRFRACWVTQSLLGWAVTPRIRMRRVACSMAART